ncbi:MAG TPA: hypothetical protein VJ579_04505 [Candidatus Paceibacterota bacterium]|nr:hypothetical protein [Candidatus Paceibacterota bacterium]
MRKYIFAFVAIAILTVGYLFTTNPIDTCPSQVQEVAVKFAKHAEAKIVGAEFVKSEPTLTGKVVRHYYDVTFKQGDVSRTRRISLPVDHGTVCAANFIN